jgi:hypothetical protein
MFAQDGIVTIGSRHRRCGCERLILLAIGV